MNFVHFGAYFLSFLPYPSTLHQMSYYYHHKTIHHTKSHYSLLTSPYSTFKYKRKEKEKHHTKISLFFICLLKPLFFFIFRIFSLFSSYFIFSFFSFFLFVLILISLIFHWTILHSLPTTTTTTNYPFPHPSLTLPTLKNLKSHPSPPTVFRFFHIKIGFSINIVLLNYKLNFSLFFHKFFISIFFCFSCFPHMFCIEKFAFLCSTPYFAQFSIPL